MTDSAVAVDRRVAILDAATDLFAQHGLTGTSIKEIGRRAGVNPALIYYYFADKTALYQAVLERLVSAMPERLMAAAGMPGSAAAALDQVIRAQAELFLSQPALPRLIARELADHAARHATDLVHRSARRLLAAMTALIGRGQADGAFRSDVEPELAAVSIIAQLNWYCVAGPVVEQVLDRPGVTRDPAEVRRFADHAVRFALVGLHPDREAI